MRYIFALALSLTACGMVDATVETTRDARREADHVLETEKPPPRVITIGADTTTYPDYSPPKPDTIGGLP